MNDIHLPSFQREDYVGNSSLSETVHGHIYKELLFNQLRTVSKNYPPANEGFPPFSLFREFLAWIVGAKKDFLILGNKGNMSYKEVFKLLKENKIWYGPSITCGDREFMVPPNTITRSASLRIDDKGNKYVRVPGVHWFTNLDHGRRHEPLSLMSMKDNLRYSKHQDLKTRGYIKYDNYDAIDVPYADSIPNDYTGIMGVPVSFLDKYCPEQFVIIGIGTGDTAKELGIQKNYRGRTDLAMTDPITGKTSCPFSRILIRKI